MLNKFSNIVDLFFMSTYMQVIKMTMFFFPIFNSIKPVEQHSLSSGGFEQIKACRSKLNCVSIFSFLLRLSTC